MATLSIPLRSLQFGHDAVPPINVRQVGRDADIAPLADSIRAHGLIQHLEVQTTDDGVCVADGNRRLAALRSLLDAGLFPPDHPVECEEVDPDADPLEISLAANVMRSALHPADEYVAFVDLADRGLGENEIAARFGIKAQRVRRILALGRLAPAIIDAWRTGVFGRDEVACVRAFTLAPSIAEQEKVFARLQKTRSLYPHAITATFGGADRNAIRNVNFVGKDVYRAAGGRMIEDLFGNDHVVADPDLAKKLANERLALECKKLVDAGWLWAECEWNLPQGATWSWSRAEHKPATPKKAVKVLIETLKAARAEGSIDEAGRAELAALEQAQLLAGYPDDLRTRSGVIVSIDSQGELSLRPGYFKPSKSAAPKGEKGEPKEKKPPSISNAMSERLSIELTLATRKALASDPAVGLSALLAGFPSHEPYRDPIRVRQAGYKSDYVVPLDERESFADVFKRVLAMSEPDRLRLAAGIAASALDLVRLHVDQQPLADVGISALLSMVDGQLLEEALAETFDAADYFASVSKPLVLQALSEAGFADQQATTSKLSRAELVAFAVEYVPKTGWLPPQLRSVHYAGPGRSA